MRHSLTFAQFVAGEIGRDRTTIHAARMERVQDALSTCLLGGQKTPYESAIPFAVGKTLLARAYAAAFAAVPAPAILPRASGKLTTATAADRAAADAAADVLADKWSEAFCAVMPLTVKEKTQEEKDAAKAKREKTLKDKAMQIARDSGMVEGGHALVGMAPPAIADAIIQMVGAGAFDLANLQAMASAIVPAIRALQPAKADKPVESSKPVEPVESSKPVEPVEPVESVNPDRAAQQREEDEARVRMLAQGLGGTVIKSRKSRKPVTA